MFQAIRLYLENMETVTDSLGSQKRPPWSMIQLAYQSAQGSGSAHARAATAPVQRQKRTLEREILVADYSGNLRQHFFDFASHSVSQRRRSAQALLTLASPSAQVAQSRSCSPFQ